MPVSSIDPILRAGWEPDVPVEDSLLRRFIVNWTLSIEANGVPIGGRVLRRDDVAAVDVGRPSFGANVATLTAPVFPAEVKEVATALDDFYEFSIGTYTGTAFLFSPWPTPDLQPYGWKLMGYEPLMLRPAGGDAPSLPDGLRVEEVKDEIGLREFERAILGGFESEDLEAQGAGALFGDAILTDDRFRIWVGWEGDNPVTAASTFVEAGINDVTLVGTVPSARRRGYGAALTLIASLAEPSLPALLLSTDQGRPVYERIGYLPLFRFAVWSHDR
jgi:hypothetical protein